MEKLLSELNQAQREAVLYCDGPQLIVAGAGSGKTRTLTYKIAYLLKKGVKPERILALTFTNKASEEMRARIDNLLGLDLSRKLWMGTFHSIFGRILRIEAEKIGFTSSYTINDASDSANMVKSIIREFKLSEENYKYRVIYSRISLCKNNMIIPEAYAANQDCINLDINENRPEFYNIYQEYVSRCRKSNVMDFDDLILYTNILFKINKDSLEKFRNLFDYILVDEYQDTNFAQYLIIHKLSKKHRKICVVGDDAQSIYSFRGARIQNILNFKSDYPDCRLFKLEQNYRSTQRIVRAANSLIAKNKEQIPKVLFSEKAEGSLIVVHESSSDQQEGYDVGTLILKMIDEKNYNYSDFAVLYRTNAQSRIFEEVFRNYEIPYRVYGALSFYQRKEIKDVLAYARVVVNVNDTEALKRIINYPSRKIGLRTVEKVFELAAANEVTVWDILSNPIKYGNYFGTSAISGINSFVSLINSLREKINVINAYDFFVELVNRSGINDDLRRDTTSEGVSRYENLQELLNSVKSYVKKRHKYETDELRTAVNFLHEVSLLTGPEEDESEEEQKNKVTLMTVHAAKGLEFKNVFIVGVEDELFPSWIVKSEPSELEEERRLFYVAMTRAMENLHIFHARRRFRYGKTIEMHRSQFIDEIDSKYLFFINPPQQNDDDDDEDDDYISFEDEYNGYWNNSFSESNKRQINYTNKPNYGNLSRKNLISINKYHNTASFINANFEDLCEGRKVFHENFGEGIIKEVFSVNNSTRAKIDFGGNGIRTIILDAQKLKIIS